MGEGFRRVVECGSDLYVYTTQWIYFCSISASRVMVEEVPYHTVHGVAVGPARGADSNGAKFLLIVTSLNGWLRWHMATIAALKVILVA